ncbi:MAG TPA: hypothetical protein VK401_11140 [Propionibacteriaceae bacterium]|nr:hypothetical protein [Propionibacteriaceae bacterium]
MLTGGGVGPTTSGAPVTVLALGRDFTDPDGGFAAAYALGSEDALLVRPDGYVAWGGPLSGMPEAMVAVTGGPALVDA